MGIFYDIWKLCFENKPHIKVKEIMYGTDYYNKSKRINGLMENNI